MEGHRNKHVVNVAEVVADQTDHHKTQIVLISETSEILAETVVGSIQVDLETTGVLQDGNSKTTMELVQGRHVVYVEEEETTHLMQLSQRSKLRAHLSIFFHYDFACGL